MKTLRYKKYCIFKGSSEKKYDTDQKILFVFVKNTWHNEIYQLFVHDLYRLMDYDNEYL